MKRNRTIVKRVLAVNLIITLVLLGVMMGNSLFLLNTVKENSDNDTRMALRALASTFEDEYFRLNQLMTLCNDDPDLILALTTSTADTGFPKYLKNAMEKMSLIKASMPYADNVYAYKTKNDSVITTDKGVLEAADFWERYADEEIRESLLGTANVLTATDRGMYFICPIQKYGSIVIDINIREFSDMLLASSLNSGVELVIYDRAGAILLKNQSFPVAEAVEFGQQQDGKITVGETAYYMYSQDIPSIGYSCVIFNPVNMVESNLQSVNAVCILALVLAALFSMALLLYNHKIYRPVQKLISTFGPEDGEGNEIAYIARRLEELTKKEQYQSRMGDQEDLNVSLYYLFYNEIDGIHLNARINRLYDGASLVLLAFQDITGQPDRYLATALGRELGGVLAVNCDAYMTAFILPKGLEREQFLHHLQDFISQKKEGKAFVSFSKSFTEGYSVKDAFVDALAQLEATAIESSEVLTVSSAENRKNGVRYIKLDIQQQIVNCVIKSDMELIDEILGLILHGGSSLAEYRSVCKTIASLLDYMVNTWSLDLKPEFAYVNYDKMYHPGYMTNSLLDYFREISQAYQKGAHASLRDSVIEFLNQNYGKPLSLDSIAEQFHITPTYLSSFFKREVGENFSSYLANLRIAEAKRMLEETDLKVSDISEQVGIYSQTTFIRLFKKNCGLTPNEYRKAHGGTGTSDKNE